MRHISFNTTRISPYVRHLLAVGVILSEPSSIRCDIEQALKHEGMASAPARAVCALCSVHYSRALYSRDVDSPTSPRALHILLALVFAEELGR